MTRIGDAWVTAAHVGRECLRAIDALDISIVADGKTPNCRNGLHGENVFLFGFPDGPAVDRGVVYRVSHNMSYRDHRGLVVERRGVTVVLARSVEAGFSGGGAVSVDDGRVIGVILAVGPVVQDDFRPVIIQPVESICRALNH